MKKITVLTLAICAIMLSGCVAGNTVHYHKHRSTTIGQELLDLNKAKTGELVTQAEYDKMKQEIIKSFASESIIIEGKSCKNSKCCQDCKDCISCKDCKDCKKCQGCTSKCSKSAKTPCSKSSGCNK